MNVCWCLKGDVSEPWRLDPEALPGLFLIRVLLSNYKCASAVVFVHQVLSLKCCLWCCLGKMRKGRIQGRLKGERGKSRRWFRSEISQYVCQIFSRLLKEGMYKRMIVLLNLVADLRDLVVIFVLFMSKPWLKSKLVLTHGADALHGSYLNSQKLEFSL